MKVESNPILDDEAKLRRKVNIYTINYKSKKLQMTPSVLFR